MNPDRFKFRVWDVDEKCYGAALCEMPLPDGCWQLMNTALPGYEDRFIIEQCTGLRDKNGKLIYEGDVVYDGFIRFTVIWENGCFGYDYCGFHKAPEWIGSMEIVGNIHEVTE